MTRKNNSNFGTDPDKSADPGFFLTHFLWHIKIGQLALAFCKRPSSFTLGFPMNREKDFSFSLDRPTQQTTNPSG